MRRVGGFGGGALEDGDLEGGVQKVGEQDGA